MKKFLFVFAVFLLAGICSLAAQDLIVLKDGSMIEAKVLEISPTEIRYKRFDNLDGPTVVVPAADVHSIRYENGKTEAVNADPKAKSKSFEMDPKKLYFALAADPSGFLMYGPFVMTEFSKNHFNSQVYVSFPSVGLLVKADGFGIGAGGSFNYLFHTKLGVIYLGGLFDYNGYKINMPGLKRMQNGKYTDGKYDYPSDSLWQSNYTLAINLGYKFIFSSGLYLTTGGNLGASMMDDIRKHGTSFNFFAKPSLSAGYMF